LVNAASELGRELLFIRQWRDHLFHERSRLNRQSLLTLLHQYVAHRPPTGQYRSSGLEKLSLAWLDTQITL
jgi:hypothetical protein